MPTPKTPVRIGEAERAAAQRALQEHLNAGRLQVTEYADRAATAANAVTAPEIAALFTDLPAPHPKLPGSPLGAVNRTLAIAGGAVVLVLAGLLALVLSRSGDAAPPPSAAPPVATPSAAPPAVRVVPSSAPRVTPSASASAAALPGAATVRRTTGAEAITLRPGYNVDLDDDTSPNWSVGTGGYDRDVAWSSRGDELYLFNDYAVMPGPADYTACSRETGYTGGPIERGSLQPDQHICVRTTGDRYALVTIVDVSDQAVRFQATVWDPPISS